MLTVELETVDRGMLTVELETVDRGSVDPIFRVTMYIFSEANRPRIFGAGLVNFSNLCFKIVEFFR